MEEPGHGIVGRESELAPVRSSSGRHEHLAWVGIYRGELAFAAQHTSASMDWVRPIADPAVRAERCHRQCVVAGQQRSSSIGRHRGLSPPHDGATRYRIVAATRPSADSEPVVPTLEDGYVLLAQQHSLTAAESAA
jgi:hypothetical protein